MWYRQCCLLCDTVSQVIHAIAGADISTWVSSDSTLYYYSTCDTVSHNRQHCLYHISDNTVCVTQQTALSGSHYRQHCLILYYMWHCITKQTALSVSHNTQHCLYHITDNTVCITQQTALSVSHYRQHCLILHYMWYCITQHTALSVSHHRQHCLYHITDSTVWYSITCNTVSHNTQHCQAQSRPSHVLDAVQFQQNVTCRNEYSAHH